MLEDTTGVSPRLGAGDQHQVQTQPALGIVWHPDLTRVGEFAFLPRRGADCAFLSRTVPLFSAESCSAGDDATSGKPLFDRHVSRSPIIIVPAGRGAYEITPPESSMWVSVNGRKITQSEVFSLDELGRDIIISLSDKIILSLFESPVERSSEAQNSGLIGISAELQKIWSIIQQAAPTDLPVLIEGKTGTGKELVAQALHALSRRSCEQMLSVNMATVSGDLAMADLFGASKGAFTGSVRDRMGLFEHANESTLFLDEIGNTPSRVQPMLLRALEAGEIRRVGETKVRHITARIVAATDQPLGQEQFNQPLLRRLEAIKIKMPLLAARRVDIGLLVRHFMQKIPSTAAHLGEDMVPGGWIARLALYDWPGNVRELRSAVQQMALGQQPSVIKGKSQQVERKPCSTVVKPRKKYRSSDNVDEKEMLAALDTNEWCIKSAAQSLNISRTALYELISKSPNVRKANDLSDREIREVIGDNPHDVGMLAKKLRVSRTALKNRIKRLSLQ